MITEQPIGRAVLYVSSNVAPEAHRAFSQWCDSIHHFDTMRIDGFLSLRRFELVTGTTAPGTPEYRMLTLYQVADARDADFSTPSYEQHTATYSPPPDGVVDHITYERQVLDRVEDTGAAVQLVGRACISAVGEDGAWIDEAAALTGGCPGVLQAHRVEGAGRAVLLVDVEAVDDGRRVLDAISTVDHGGSLRSLQLFEQVFPPVGVLGRDRKFLSPIDAID